MIFSSNDTVFTPQLVNKEQMYSGQCHEIFLFHSVIVALYAFFSFWYWCWFASLSHLIWSAYPFLTVSFSILILTLVEQSLFSTFCLFIYNFYLWYSLDQSFSCYILMTFTIPPKFLISIYLLMTLIYSANIKISPL